MSIGKLVLASLGLTALACASGASGAVDWTQVRVVEQNREGMEHLALPEEMAGCEYLGRVRTTGYSAATGARPTAEAILEDLKKKAARKGGDTLTVLPGLRVEVETVRGSVFRCGGSS